MWQREVWSFNQLRLRAHQVLANSNPSFGYNAATGVYEDLMAAGIIDPTKVLGFTAVVLTSRESCTFTFNGCK